MDQYDAAKDKKKRWRCCGMRRIHLGSWELIALSVILTAVYFKYGDLVFSSEEHVDFRIGDVCAHMRLIDHPISTPKEGSRLLVIIDIDTMEQLGNAFDQILMLIDNLGKAELYVSVSINRMLDLAPPWIDMFRSLLKSKRIPFVYFFEGERFHLQPLWDRSYDATHVIAIRNSFFCAEDILRIYWQIGSESNLACGLQFAQARKRQLRLDATDFTLHSLGIFRDQDRVQQETPALKNVFNGFTTPLGCCWSNIVGIAASLISSEPDRQGNCLGYDCLTICEKAKGAQLMPSVPVVPDLNTRSLLAVAPLYPQIHPQAVPEV